MKRWSSAQLLRAVEYAYATLALFALTQGPVYQVWRDSATRVVALSTPSMPFVYFASFVVVQLPAVALFARRVHLEWFLRRSNQALLTLLGWLGLSVFWATFGRQSLPEFVALVLTSAFGAYLSISFTPRQFVRLVGSAMALGVATSWFAVMRLWDGAYNFLEDYWIGIYFNRNSLAPVAAVAVVSATAILISEWRFVRDRVVVGFFGVCLPSLTLVGFASIELWKSESQTAPLALAAGLAVLPIWWLIRWLALKLPHLEFLGRFAAPLTLVVLGIASLVFFREIGQIGGVSADFSTLNSRRFFWSQSWLGILEKPWHGWGWMSAWRTPEFFTLDSPPPAWVNSWSHNGYHDILLGGGVISGVLFGAYLMMSWLDLDKKSFRLGSFDMLLSTFVLISATQESFFIGSHFLWALLLAVHMNSSPTK